MNVGTLLREHATGHPDRAAIIAPRGAGWARVSFGNLDSRSDAIAHGLLGYGVERGERVLVMVRAGIDLITLTYALFKAGAVPVLIDPGMGRNAFLRCVLDTRPTAFVGIPMGHVLRLLFPAPFRSVRRVVTVGRRLLWGGTTLAALEAAGSGKSVTADVKDDDVAAVLFTSGSTGPAKGAVYNHGNFAAQVEALRASYGFEPGEVDLAAFPLFSLFDGAFGMTSVIPRLDSSRPATCDPGEIVDALRDHACTTAFGSPAVWRRVAPFCVEREIRLPGLRRILIAGASVPPSLIEMLRRVLPNGDVHTPYGATEALPVATLSGHEVVAETGALHHAGKGTCVGGVVPPMLARAIRISDDPISSWSDDLVVPDGEVGEICVAGPVVTRSYQGREDATAAAKIRDGGRVWHRMGDLGYFDPKGRLWFAGRKAERVRTAGGCLFTDLVEGRVQGLSGSARCALVGVGPAGSEEPVVVVEGSRDEGLAWRIAELLPLRAVLFHPRFPVDTRHNAKIHRLTLKRWAETQLGASS